ncbi:MAG TPA: aspartate kinase [Halanaerobiales bacterium]|nr:aspartate kinase [Halanaerobiales bacterium]
MKKIVQKFGGTSLNSDKKRKMAAKKVKKAVDKGYSPIVVVSAMGRFGDAYATDTLINIATEITSDIDPREKDLLMSCGEVISAVTFVQYLKKLDLDGLALTGSQAGIETNKRHGESRVKQVKPDRIFSALKEDKIPVVAGFQGESDDNEITTLGRGGSDTTASILADAVQGEYIEIYTDVDGLMTADPGLVDNAKTLDKISYKEACELAYQGARVIHPRAAEIARSSFIPIKIKSIYSNKPGTLIHKTNFKKIESDKMITGVASRNNIVFIKIKNSNQNKYESGLKIFDELANEEISVDFINIRRQAISFIVIKSKYDNLINVLENGDYDFDISDQYVKLSLVGGGMTGRPGVMARVVEALNKKGISIFQTTDSHTTISCLIKAKDEKKALNTLHEAFNLSK